MKGKEASYFFGKVEKLSESKLSMKKINNLIKNYEEMLKKVLKSVIETKQLISSSMTPKQINGNAFFESKILSHSFEYEEVLKNMIDNSGQIKTVERIFRAS